MMYKYKRQRLQTIGSDKWNFGGVLPFRMTSSHPAQRRKYHGGKRTFDEKTDYKSVESCGSNENSNQKKNEVTDGGNQFFNMTPKTFCHLHSGNENVRRQTPLKENAVNCWRPILKNVFPDSHKLESGNFEFSPTTAQKQQPSDWFHYNWNACCRNPSKSVDFSPTKYSVISKTSDSSEFSSNSNSTNDFLKFSGRNHHCLEEFHNKSLDNLNFSTHSVENRWNARHQEKLIEEKPSVGPYPETPESNAGRSSPQENYHRRILFPKEEFEGSSNGAFQILPVGGKSLPKFDFPNNAFPNFKFPFLPSKYKERSDFFKDQDRTGWHPNMPFSQKLKPFLSDPDEEYAKMRMSCTPASRT